MIENVFCFVFLSLSRKREKNKTHTFCLSCFPQNRYMVDLVSPGVKGPIVYDIHCQRNEVATPDEVFAQNMVMHHDPRIAAIYHSKTIRDMWWSSIVVMFHYNQKYTSAYTLRPLEKSTVNVSLSVSDRKLVVDGCATCSATHEGLCGRCRDIGFALLQYDLYMYHQSTSTRDRCAEITNLQKLYRIPMKRMFRLNRKPVATIPKGPHGHRLQEPNRINEQIISVTTDFPLPEHERLEIAKTMTNHRWIYMGMGTDSLVPAWMSCMQFLFRALFAWTTPYFGTAVARYLPESKALDTTRLKCPKPYECYYCHATQLAVDIAHRMIPTDEFDRYRELIWNQSKAMFHIVHDDLSVLNPRKPLSVPPMTILRQRIADVKMVTVEPWAPSLIVKEDDEKNKKAPEPKTSQSLLISQYRQQLSSDKNATFDDAKRRVRAHYAGLPESDFVDAENVFLTQSITDLVQNPQTVSVSSSSSSSPITESEIVNSLKQRFNYHHQFLFAQLLLNDRSNTAIIQQRNNISDLDLQALLAFGELSQRYTQLQRLDPYVYPWHMLKILIVRPEFEQSLHSSSSIK